MVKVRSHFKSVLGVCAIGLPFSGALPAARADMVTYTDAVPLTSTNWADELSFPLFDPSLGVLEHVELTLSVTVDALVQLESLDSGPADLYAMLSSEVQVDTSGGAGLLGISLDDNVSRSVSAFDGLMDFDGASGATVAVVHDATDSVILDSDLGMFIGSGSLQLPISAEAESQVGGAGNLLAMLSTSASVNATLDYHFTQVPAPSAAMLGAMGFGLVGWIGRRRA